VEPPARRFGPFLLNGESWELCEDPAVRARDLAEGQVTVVRCGTGEVRVFSAAAMQGPPIPGLGEIPEEDRYDLRLLVEDLISLRFDSAQADSVMGLVTARRMLREPGRP
jgi:hypothetical protein